MVCMCRSDMTAALLDPVPAVTGHPAGAVASQLWGHEEARPRAHTELGERTRSTLADAWADRKHQLAAETG